MKFSVRIFRQLVLHVLYLEKENGNVLYHLPEKRVVPVEKQMKRSIFSGTCNCGQVYRNFRAFRSKREKVLPFFRKHSTEMNRSIWILSGITENSIQMVSAPRKLKQRQRRRHRERHNFAYLVGKNNSFARPARAFFTFVHFFAVLCKTTTWNG